MIIQMDEKLKKELSRDGSHLKYTRTRGGAGAGLVAAGCCFIGIGLLLAAGLSMILELSGILVLAAGGVVLGAIFIIPGTILSKKHLSGYMKYYVKKSGYSEEELQDFDRDFMNGEGFLISTAKKLTKQAKFESGFISDKWFQLPFMMPLIYSGIYRIVDIAAVFHDPKLRVNGENKGPILVVVDSRGETMTVGMKADVGNEIIQEISKRNPKTVTMRKFSYNGKNYDVLFQYEEVAELYREICSSR